LWQSEKANLKRRNGIGEADVKRQEQLLASAESDQKFAEKEYQTQIQLLKSEVETVHLVVETAEQTLARTQQLYESKVASSHEVDKHKRELTEAMQRLDRVKLLLSLYLEAEA
jgi:multidrug resistance efflux pump